MHCDCATVSQFQDPALILGVDGVRMGLEKAHGTDLLPNSLGDMLGKNWCRQRGKRSHYGVNLLSSCTCDTIFVECLVVDECGNVTIRIGR